MLDKKTVHHIAKLARLKVTDEELDAYSRQLSAVLDHFQEISKVDTASVPPLLTPSEIAMNLRGDVVERQGQTEELMKNAPERSGHLFKVPPVV